jgi:Ohr subfamily peroxiredoxin
MPKALGGANNDFTNPEMLFAAGYSACFDTALDRAISLSKTQKSVTSVAAKVSIVQNEDGGFGLAVKLDVNIPGISIEEAHELTEKAHQICPYSNATRSNF